MEALEALVVDAVAARRTRLSGAAAALRAPGASVAPRRLTGYGRGPALLLTGTLGGPAGHPAGVAAMLCAVEVLGDLGTRLLGDVVLEAGSASGPAPAEPGAAAPRAALVAAPTDLLVALGPGVGHVAPIARRILGAQVSIGLPFGTSTLDVAGEGVPTAGFGPCDDAIVCPDELVRAAQAVALVAMRFCGVEDVSTALQVPPLRVPRAAPLG